MYEVCSLVDKSLSLCVSCRDVFIMNRVCRYAGREMCDDVCEQCDVWSVVVGGGDG